MNTNVYGEHGNDDCDDDDDAADAYDGETNACVWVWECCMYSGI